MKLQLSSLSFVHALPSLGILGDFLTHHIGGTTVLQSCTDLLGLNHVLGLTLFGAGTVGALLLLRQLPVSPLSWLFGPVGEPNEFHNVSDPASLTVPGLRNVANNCFLNSVLQALASSDWFVSYLAAYDTELSAPLQAIENSCPKIPLTTSLLSLLEELTVLNTESHVVNPVNVMLALEPYLKQFDLASQQDAAEVLAHLASALQREWSGLLHSLRVYAVSLVDASNSFSEGKQSAFDKWKMQSRWPMEGSLGSMLTCRQCGFKFSTQFDSFHDVSLPPPRLPNGNIVDECTIDDCLKNFTTCECISGVKCNRCSHYFLIHKLKMQGMVKKDVLNAFIEKMQACTFDDNCHCERFATQSGEEWRHVYVNAAKQLKFGRCPELLCFHVQRASINGAGSLIKWKGHVSFPFVLNLLPFSISTHCHMIEKAKFSGSRMHGFDWIGCNTQCGGESTLDDNESHHSVSTASEDSVSDDSFESISQKAEVPVSIPETTAEFELASEISALTKHLNLWEPKSALIHVDLTGPMQLLHTSSHLLSLSGLESHAQFKLMNYASSLNYAISMPSNFVHSFPCAAYCQDDEVIQGVENNADSRRCLYELISVVVHYGTPRSGHYMVYRRMKVSSDGNSKEKDCLVDGSVNELDGSHDKKNQAEGFSRQSCLPDLSSSTFSTLTDASIIQALEEQEQSKVLWFRISDSDVNLVTEDEVLRAQASLLFYEKCKERLFEAGFL